ncbi:DUF2057 domain-containing protein [Colwellia echini]|uniref:DUF2057 domain-containing protein n=1 Tax=Colwellia echini TaxID=1982103 RepID=A0ABY3N0V6_9GAMM|nr:DUF2057 domain-containing protein [Colwellia echini]
MLHYCLYSFVGCLSYRCLAIIVVSFIPHIAIAATLTLSDNLVLRDIDDKPIEKSFFSQQQTFELPAGEHVIVIKYKDVFEDLELGEERLVSSDYFVVKFSFNSQQSLALTTGNIKNLTAAELYVKSPVLTLRDENNRELPLVLETLNDYEMAKEVSKQLAISSTTSVAPTNVSPTTTLNSTQPKTISDNPSVNKVKTQVSPEVDAVPMLKYWWQKASKQQKASFMQFINDNN